MRDGDVWFQRRSNHQARCMREPKVLGHLLAVSWSSAVRSSRHVVCLKFGIRFANEHAAWTAMARPTPKLLYPCLLSCRCLAENPAYAESSAYADWEQSPRIRLHAPEARSYESSDDSEWTKSPHRGTKTNGMALRGGDGNTPHDHPRRGSDRYPDSRLRVDRPPDRSVNHNDPLDGSGWAETPADCRSEGP